MCGRSVRVLVVLAVLGAAAAQVQGSSPYDRVAYWDGSSGTAWGGDGVALRDALKAAGYTVLNAAELKTWMDARISDGRLSVVVMCQDVAPSSVVETVSATCTIRRYLDAGGKVVWYADWPFYYIGTTSNSPAGNGAVQILGFDASSGPNNSGQTVTITEAGYRWGLTTPWSSQRPTSPTITSNMTILALDGNGSAPGWVKHFLPGDTFRGFVRIDDHSGAPVNIPQLMAVAEYYEVSTTAVSPVPGDGATDVPRDAAVSWTPGELAATHDVYFGSAYADVNDASRADPKGVLASQGQTDVAYDPDGLLEYGQTYYWRIDEVNGAPDNTIYGGQVWSFTVEPFSYPITAVTATASSEQPGMVAMNTVNGAGLNASDEHSTDSTQMWMSAGTQPNWIQFQFDRVYKLDELWVWNSNQLIEAFIGFGAKDVTFEYSTDGQTWTTLEGVPPFAQASGSPTYKANTVVDCAGVMAQYVKLTINASWGGLPQTGLAEVRFFYTPVQAREPSPVDGATGVGLDASMNWRPGREATSHTVYFGSDNAAVTAGTAPASTVTSHGFTPAAMEFGTTYYWRADEVGDTGTYEGGVWSFTTEEFATVEDFESYDDEDNRIYNAWLDGYSAGTSGSTVGHMEAPFAEQSIVHGGRQSMPMAYDNTVSPYYSEAEHEFAAVQNMTGNGATELCVWTRGYPALASVAVTETGGKMSLTGAGADIWNNSDEFTFAYKTLNGDGALIARVASNGTGTNAWAKGGVMIRDSVNGGSMHAMMVITAHTAASAAGNGASFQYRAATNGGSGNSDSTTVVAPPYWVKIERIGSSLKGSTSADGKTWTQVGSTDIAMEDPVLIGLAVTSHAAGENRTYEFDNISMTGTVTGAWQGAVVNSSQYNSAQDMYLIVEDSNGKTAKATSATAALTADWTAWKIPMSSLTGVNLSKISKLYIGVGTKGATTSGGTGIVYIDDIGYGRTAGQ
ncbi:MAG: discoidin domain-containing protein [Solirubrobacterales bacterium]